VGWPLLCTSLELLAFTVLCHMCFQHNGLRLANLGDGRVRLIRHGDPVEGLGPGALLVSIGAARGGVRGVVPARKPACAQTQACGLSHLACILLPVLSGHRTPLC
jgi:hypothetical protein